mgnify:CR=1 FL=1
MKKPNDRYKKYRYIIWSDEEGFFSLESLSKDDLKNMATQLSLEIDRRSSGDGRKESKEIGDI